MAAPAATHAARGGRRGSRGRGGRGAGHVSAVGGAGLSPASGFPFAACGGRCAVLWNWGSGSGGLVAGALRARVLWERGGTPVYEQAFPALSCRVKRLFLPKVTGRLNASRGGSI